MIALITGTLVDKTAESVVVDAGGVGYEVFVPLTTFYELPDLGERVTLKIHTHLKDDAIQLFGFLTGQEKEVFRLLISVAGIGPKLAKNILSGVEVPELVGAIASADKARLAMIPGIGAKSAERLILELKDKVAVLGEAAGPMAASRAAREGGSVTEDVVSALGNLGYKPAQAADAVKKAKEEMGEGPGFEELLRAALKALTRR